MRRAAWAAAHHLLGIDAARDRFSDVGWEFCLEEEIAGLLVMPLLVSGDPDAARGSLLTWLDEFVRRRWVECLRDYQYMRRRERARHRRARVIYRGMRGRNGWHGASPVLASLAEAIQALACESAWRCSSPVRDRLPVRRYSLVVGRLGALGVPVLWLAIDRDAQASSATVQRRSWGLEVSLPLPAPAEVLAVDGRAWADHTRMVDVLKEGFGRLRPRFDAQVTPSVAELSGMVHRWLAASLFARDTLESLPVAFLHVLVDKDIEARAFVAESRRQGIPTAYHYGSMELGPPSYWPFADRILVATNEARAQRLVHELDIPPSRVHPVGSLEIDEVPAQLGAGPAPRAGAPRRFVSLLAELGRVPGDWTCVLRPHPNDRHDYSLLERAFPERVQISRSNYGQAHGMVPTLLSADLVVSAMGNAAFCAIVAGKPTIIYNPNPKVNFGHERLFRRSDVPQHVRLVERREDLVQLLTRAILGEEGALLAAAPLEPSLVHHLFQSLDGRSADRIVAALLEKSWS